MSANRSHAYPIVAQPDGGGLPRARSTPATEEADPGEGTLGPVPPPLPADPKVRAELFARLKRGIAEAQSGHAVDWEELDRRTRAKYRLPPA
jgi:hypothetical protein